MRRGVVLPFVLGTVVGLGCSPLPVEVDTAGSAGGTTTTITTTSSMQPTGYATTGADTSVADGQAEGSTTSMDSTTGPPAPLDGESTLDPSTGPDPGSSTSMSTDDTSDTGTEASCDELYGGAPDYILCVETDTECHFNATTNGNCNDMCASLGGRCIEAFDNPNIEGQECSVIEPNMDDCTTERTTELCVCTKP